MRARQHRRNDKTGDQVLPVLIHGDAAFAGQGVVMETLNLAQTRGYGTGGTVHIIVNNQIGFTTSDPRDARSTLYCTDVAKMLEAPIFHVNGDDPEAVLFVTEIALDFRMKFQKDVVIDLVCFRRLGHNEQDEPMVTQPLMYKKIAQHPGTRKLYADKLVAQGVDQRRTSPTQMIKHFRAGARRGLSHRQARCCPTSSRQFEIDWAPFLNAKWNDADDTARAARGAAGAGRAHHRGARRTSSCTRRSSASWQSRRQMARGQAAARLGHGGDARLRVAAVAKAIDVRLSGQDTGRGTFSHRHAVLHDQNREQLGRRAATCRCSTSARTRATSWSSTRCCRKRRCSASSTAISSAEPNELVIWEAQFGDFANGAQVVIDQFIASGEAKWGRMCGLVHVAAARLRRAGARALLGAPRALPAAVRRAQHAGLRAVDAGADLPPAAPADAARRSASRWS